MMDNDFPSNIRPEPGKPAPKKVVEKVVVGEVGRRKKPLGSRLKETFVNGVDARSVWTFVMFDVVVPSLKDLLVDAGKEALERSFYGDSRGSRLRSGRPSHVGRTTYNSMYASNPVGRASGRPPMSDRSRAQQNTDDLVFETRVEAEEVLHNMYELIQQYEVATLQDLYMLAGISAGHTDNKWGWTSLPGAGVSRTRQNEYVLDLPKPVFLD